MKNKPQRTDSRRNASKTKTTENRERSRLQFTIQWVHEQSVKNATIEPYKDQREEKTKPPSKETSRPQSTKRCSRCERPGHQSSKCLGKNDDELRELRRQGRCFSCQERGHLSKECPMKNELKKLQSNRRDYEREKKEYQTKNLSKKRDKRPNRTPTPKLPESFEAPSIYEDWVVYPRQRESNDAKRRQRLIAYQELKSKKLRIQLERL